MMRRVPLPAIWQCDCAMARQPEAPWLVWALVRGRAVAAVPFAGLILADQSAAALGLLALAAVSDWADGWIARRWRAGGLLHALDDCLADMAFLFAGVLASLWQGLLPPLVAPVILASFAFYLVTLPLCPAANPLGKAWGPVLALILALGLAAPPGIAVPAAEIGLTLFALACAGERCRLIFGERREIISGARTKPLCPAKRPLAR
jgi:phosphatidylglycerophosphate synthase